MPPTERQILYCYVDETGQDASANFFVVVAVVSERDQESLRQALIDIEQLAGTGRRKWHKTRPARRMHYLTRAFERNVGSKEVFFSSYPKPIPYFFPLIEVLEYAIKAKATGPYTARIFVDGIDRKKAMELTNALRLRGVSLEMVRSRRDESEPLIRLADMWAGCIRGAQEGGAEEQALVARATQAKYLRPTRNQTL